MVHQNHTTKISFRILMLMSFILSIATLNAQKKDKREGAYSVHLYSVDVPKDFKAGKIDTLLSTYEDSVIKIDWDYAESQIGFNLTNKSDQTLKVIWDDAAYISITNESGRIFHKGIKYIDRENPQPPTSVYKNTTLSDLVAPTSNVHYVTGQYGGWRSDPIIPINHFAFSSKIEYNELLIGKTIRVVLPLKMEERTLEYSFNFRTEFIEKKKK
jgi:hypothetical protein